MNRIKSLILAAGIALAATTLAAPAHADPNGPGDIQIGPIVDPPQPEPQPAPDGPGEIVNPPKCTHGCGDLDPAPDVAPAPDEEQVTNGGPLIALDPEDDPAHDAPLDQGCFTGCDLPEPAAAPVTQVETTPVLESAKPSAAEQLDRAEVRAPSPADDAAFPVPLLGAGVAGLVLAALARRRRKQADQA